jgi:hypothetical protein
MGHTSVATIRESSAFSSYCFVFDFLNGFNLKTALAFFQLIKRAIIIMLCYYSPSLQYHNKVNTEKMNLKAQLSHICITNVTKLSA